MTDRVIGLEILKIYIIKMIKYYLIIKYYFFAMCNKKQILFSTKYFYFIYFVFDFYIKKRTIFFSCSQLLQI